MQVRWVVLLAVVGLIIPVFAHGQTTSLLFTPAHPSTLYTPTQPFPPIERENTPVLTIDSLSSTRTNRVGMGTDTDFGYMHLFFASNEKVENVTLTTDGKTRDIIFETNPYENGYQIVDLFDVSKPASAWLDNGDHIVTFTLHAPSKSFIATARVHVDKTPPIWERTKEGIRLSDNEEIMGATLYLLARDASAEPVVLKSYYHAIDQIPLNETNAAVADGTHFRLISVSDRTGNTTHFTPDDPRGLETIMKEYATKLPLSSPDEGDAQLKSADAEGSFGTIYIAHNETNNWGDIPGLIFQSNNKTANTLSILQFGTSMLNNVGNPFPYLNAKMKSPTMTQTSVLTMTQSLASGLVLKPTLIPLVDGTSLTKYILVADYSDPAAFNQFLKSLRQNSPNRMPVVLVDRIDNHPSGKIIAFYDLTNGIMVIDYNQLTDFTPTFGWVFDTTGGTRTAAHELGHAFGLGHAKSVSNLMYAYNGSPEFGFGTQFDAEQDAATSAHTYSEGLKPEKFGIWAPGIPAGTTAPEDYTCSNRTLERGKPDSDASYEMEEGEDIYAGSFLPEQTKTVELTDWKNTGQPVLFNFVTENRFWKLCPATEKYLFSKDGTITQTKPLEIPVALPNSLLENVLEWEAFVEQAKNTGEIPHIRYTPPYQDSKVTGFNTCGCYDFCETACAFQRAYPGELIYKVWCESDSFCGNKSDTPLPLSWTKGKNGVDKRYTKSCSKAGNFDSQNQVCQDDCELYEYCASDCTCKPLGDPGRKM